MTFSAPFFRWKITMKNSDEADELRERGLVPDASHENSSEESHDTPHDTLHPAMLDEESLLARCKVRRQRRSGPGGQHRNKVETAVVIVHLPTDIRSEASERRSQEENRRRAIFRLRVKLAIGFRRPLTLEGNSPSPLWRERCQGGKVVVNPGHADFPALLAEALDVLLAADLEARHAAEWLGCSPSQFIKFLQSEPQAIEWVNRQRRELGRSPYR